MKKRGREEESGIKKDIKQKESLMRDQLDRKGFRRKNGFEGNNRRLKKGQGDTQNLVNIDIRTSNLRTQSTASVQLVLIIIQQNNPSNQKPFQTNPQVAANFHTKPRQNIT